ESERHPAREGQYPVHGRARRAAGQGDRGDGGKGHRLAGGDRPRRTGGHAHLPRSHPVHREERRRRRRQPGPQRDGRPPAHLHLGDGTGRSAPHDAGPPRALHAGDGQAHADGRDQLLRRGQGGGGQPELREPHAQGVHPRLARRRRPAPHGPTL
ncbi:MAG: CBS domain protein, partial [uncultured Ramlibacter sp.]